MREGKWNDGKVEKQFRHLREKHKLQPQITAFLLHYFMKPLISFLFQQNI